jgi:hypothetical protein
MGKDEKHKPWLTICTVNWYSITLIKSLFSNLHDKARFPERIEYIVIDNTNGGDTGLSRLKNLEISVKIYPHDSAGLKGSYGHASGLNYALTLLNREFSLVVDPDIHVFKNNWDAFLIDIMNNQDCSAVGTIYPQWQLGKYHNFPNPVFCFFRTDDFKKLKADWTPYSENVLMNCYNFVRRQILRCGIVINRNRYLKSDVVRKIWTVLEKMIGVCSQDTGYKIARQAKENNVKATLFRAVLPDEKLNATSGTDAFKQLAGQFELYCYDNEPILTHKYSTSSRIWRTDKSGDNDYWKECIGLLENEIIR